MTNRGHNENAMRLSILAEDAQRGLERVSQGEAVAIEGWLAFGAALNEGRSLFPSDEKFGQWVKGNLPDTEQKVREAAMWAAANADQFEEARAAGNARTVRGIHAKWKEIEAEREAARREEERRQKDEEDRKVRQELAEAAQKEAAEKCAVEAEARKAAEEAADEKARAEAEARVAQAAKDKVEAEKRAEEAEKAAQASHEADGGEEPDPNAEARKKLSGLTREGLEDEVIGLREENGELRKRVSKQRSEIADLKSMVKQLEANDGGRALGNAMRAIEEVKGRSAEHQASAARLQRQVNAQKAEIDKLRKSLESQEIPL